MRQGLKKSILWFALLGAMVGLSACHKETYGPEQNKAPVQTETKPSARTKNSNLTPKSLSLPSPSYFEKILAHPNSLDQVLDEVLAPLVSKLLNPNTFANKAFISSPEFFSYIRVFHKGLIWSALVDSKNKKLAGFYARYKNFALTPCINKSDLCENFKVLSHDGYYSRALLHMTDVLELGTQEAWEYVKLSLDFALFPSGEVYLKKILSIASKYLITLKASKTSTDLEEMREVNRLLTQILRDHSEYTDVIHAFYREHQILDTAPSSSPAEAALKENLFQKALKDFATIDGKPTEDFEKRVDKEIQALQQDLDEVFNKRPEYKRTLTSFRLKTLDTYDKHTIFLSHLAFSSHTSLQTLIDLGKQLKIQDEKLLAGATAYYRLQFLKTVIRTQIEMAKVLADPSVYRTGESLVSGLSKAGSQNYLWNRFREASNNLKSFLTSQRNSLSEESLLFSDLDDEIRAYATIPNMLMSLYFLSKAKLSTTVIIGSNKIDTTEANLHKALMTKQIFPWFNLGLTPEKLEKPVLVPEILTSFQNGLSSEIFTTYGVSPADFIKNLMDGYLTPWEGIVDTDIRHLKVALETGDSSVFGASTASSRSLNQIASFYKGNSLIKERIELFQLNRSLNGFRDEIFDSGSSVALYRKLANIPILILEVLDMVRTDLKYGIDIFQKMNSIYSSYLKRFGQSPALTKASQDRIDLSNGKIRTFLGLLYRLFELYDFVASEAMSMESQRQLKVLEYEEIYLKRVFRDLKAAINNPLQLTTLNKSYNRYYSNINYQGKDRLEQVSNRFIFYYNRPDFTLRMSEYLTQGVVSENGKRLPAIAPDLEILFPRDLSNQANVRESYRHFLDYNKYVTLEIDAATTEKEFLEQAYQKAYYNLTSSIGLMNLSQFVEWWTLASGSIARFGVDTKKRSLIISTLYKMGPVEVYDFGKEGCTTVMSLRKLEAHCKTTKQISMDYIYESQLKTLEITTISEAQHRLFSKSKTISLADQLKEYSLMFFDLETSEPLGVLDIFFYFMRQDALGMMTSYPNVGLEDPPSYKREGYLEHAKDFFAYQGMRVMPLLPGTEEILKDLKSLYNAYVQKSFADLYDIEAKVDAERKNGITGWRFQFNMNRPLYTVPLLTDFSQPAEAYEKEFHYRTNNIFKE